MDKRCATYGHRFSEWLNFPVQQPLTISPIAPRDVKPTYEPIRYVSKRQCLWCGYVESDHSRA